MVARHNPIKVEAVRVVTTENDRQLPRGRLAVLKYIDGLGVRYFIQVAGNYEVILLKATNEIMELSGNNGPLAEVNAPVVAVGCGLARAQCMEVGLVAQKVHYLVRKSRKPLL
jgi:hypothetical protein